jgi:manganese/zinc/iron transport system permease protein
VVGAFLIMQAFGGGGKNFGGLLLGAALAGVLAAWAVPVLRRATGLKDDAIMGVVLGGGFGLGIAMLGVAQAVPGGNQAGLESFIYGRTASMVQSDAIGIGATAAVTLVIAILLAKEFRLLCFDEAFGRALGRREGWLDLGLMLLAVTVTVVGLQAVGLILVIALLITPAAAARFWTDEFLRMIAIAGALGAVACWIGASISALAPDLPAGSIIVLTLSFLFGISMLIGTRRGAIKRLLQRRDLRRRTGQQHLLRAAAESIEARDADGWALKDLMPLRSWSGGQLRSLHRRAVRRGDVVRSEGCYAFTPTGRAAANRVVRNHRLWELFLIRYADIAPSHVDRDADLVEHVLGESLVSELEAMLGDGCGGLRSPHAVGTHHDA